MACHTGLKWFSSHLGYRKQALWCHNKLSSLVDITICVPPLRVSGMTINIPVFINDVSNVTTNGCVTNLVADGAMIDASGDDVSEVQQILQNCLNNISSWKESSKN